MKISKVIVSTSHVNLKKPYELSFTLLHSIKSNIVKIQLENKWAGLGEVTALPGYGVETHEQISNILNASVNPLIGCDENHARKYVDELYEKYPFSASAIGTALDFAYQKINIPSTIKIPLSEAVSASKQLYEIEKSAISAYKNGFRTLKVKIGKRLSCDMDTVQTLLNLPMPLSYRLDANQGYSFNDAIQLLNLIEKSDTNKLELLEQPFNKQDWQSMEKLCHKVDFPFMLDESIYEIDDIKKASDIGCKFIKLKLCKSKGINHLLNLAGYATKELGLKVVLGNGVSTDLGNFAEAVAFITQQESFYGAFEGNGFLKLDRQISGLNLSEREGYLVIDSPSFDLNLDLFNP